MTLKEHCVTSEGVFSVVDCKKLRNVFEDFYYPNSSKKQEITYVEYLFSQSQPAEIAHSI